MADRVWTADRQATLRKLWADGMTCGAIAIALKTTRNAVVGKVHRMGLPGRRSPIPRGPAPKPAVSPRAIALALPPAPVIALPEPVPRDPRYRSNGAAPGCCKFPLWPHDAVKATGPFCNVRVRRADSPYCEAHRAVAYERGVTWK